MDKSCEATIYPVLDKPRATGALQDRRKIEAHLRSSKSLAQVDIPRAARHWPLQRGVAGQGLEVHRRLADAAQHQAGGVRLQLPAADVVVAVRGGPIQELLAQLEGAVGSRSSCQRTRPSPPGRSPPHLAGITPSEELATVTSERLSGGPGRPGVTGEKVSEVSSSRSPCRRVPRTL